LIYQFIIKKCNYKLDKKIKNYKLDKKIKNYKLDKKIKNYKLEGKKLQFFTLRFGLLAGDCGRVHGNGC
jgi:hypothetical protein